MTARPRKGRPGSAPADGNPAESEAQIIPLHADESGGRTRWRLGDQPAPREPGGAAPEQPPGTGGDPTGPPAEERPAPEQDPAADEDRDPAWEQVLADLLAFLRRRAAGDYPVDDFGFDTDLSDNVLLPLLRPLYQRWFRVETIGMHHVPETGGALIVANHSGTVPLDALMLSVALHDENPQQRHLRMLGADLVFRMPVLGALARKHGGTLACNPDAERLLSDGELVRVWPEGFKGIGKPFRDRYKLQRFGRGGFVSAALRTGVPIIPCSVVGAEEIYPKIGELKPLARLLGAPYVPVTPLFPLLGPLGLIPLPSKWYIEFGEPVDTGALGPAAADDPMVVFNLNDQVRETIQFTLYRLLSHRRNPFLG